MSQGSPPSLIGGLILRRSSRKVKYSERGRQYQATMSANKLKACFRASEKVFSQAAISMAMQQNIEGSCDGLVRLRAEILETFDKLKSTEEHEDFETEYNSTIAYIDNMLLVLKQLSSVKDPVSQPSKEESNTSTDEQLVKHTGGASSAANGGSDSHDKSQDADTSDAKGTTSPTKPVIGADGLKGSGARRKTHSTAHTPQKLVMQNL